MHKVAPFCSHVPPKKELLGSLFLFMYLPRGGVEYLQNALRPRLAKRFAVDVEMWCPNHLRGGHCCPSFWECCQPKASSCHIQGLTAARMQRPGHFSPFGTTLIEHINSRGPVACPASTAVQLLLLPKPTSFHRCSPRIILQSNLLKNPTWDEASLDGKPLRKSIWCNQVRFH